MARPDPYVPDDITKQMNRRKLVDDAPTGDSAPDFGNGGGQLQPSAISFMGGLGAVGSRVADRVSPAPVAATTSGSGGGVAPGAAPSAGMARRSVLPDGVRNSNVGGIFEGKRGYYGERVFSDNQYDPLLTERGDAGRANPQAGQAPVNPTYARRPAYEQGKFNAAALDNVAGGGDKLYKYNFAGTDANGLAPTGADSAGERMVQQGMTRRGSTAYEAALQTPVTAESVLGEGETADSVGQQELQRRMGAAIASNKAALSNTRLERGEPTPSSAYAAGPGAGGVPGMPGVNPLDLYKTQSEIALKENAAALDQGKFAREGLVQNNERANALHKNMLDTFAKDPKYAGYQPTDLRDIAAMHTALQMQQSGLDPNTTDVGRYGVQLLADEMAKATNPVMSNKTRVEPGMSTLADYDVARRGWWGSLTGHPQELRGLPFKPDPSTGSMKIAPDGERNSGVGHVGISQRLAAVIGAKGEQADVLKPLILAERERRQRQLEQSQKPKGMSRRGS